MRRNIIISSAFRLADRIGSIPLSGGFRGESRTHVRPWTYSDALKRALFGLFCVGCLMLLPHSKQVFGIVGAIAIIVLVNRPKQLLYISISYLTFRYFYCADLNFVNWGSQNVSLFIPWKFISESAPFVHDADKLVTMALLVCVLNMVMFQRKRFNAVIRQTGIIRALNLFIIVAIISAVANGIGATRVFFFLQLYLRPLFFMIVLLQIPWTEMELRNFFVYILILMFPLQVVLSLIENIPNMLHGSFVFVDKFTGTFCFPYNWLCVQLLFYACLYFIALFLLKQKRKYLLAMLVIMASVFSASSGFQTLVFFISSSVFLLWLGLNSGRMYITSQSARFISFAVISILLVSIVYCYVNPDILTKTGQESYPAYAVEKYKTIGLDKNPKVQIYPITADLLTSGTINPVWGNGPTNYLSGAAIKYGNPYIMKYGTKGWFGITSGYTGMASFVENDIIGVAGEVGILGLIIYLYMFIVPVIYVKRHMRILAGTMWHAVAIAAIGSTVFMLIFGIAHVVLGNYILPVYPVLLTALSMKAVQIKNQSTKNEI